MIERIFAENYRAFESLDIDLSKINLFFGPNNSGKSSILSIINALTQTLNSSDQTVPLLLRGTKEDLGTYRDLVFNHDVSKDIVIGIQSKQHFPYLTKKSKKDYVRGSIQLKYGFRKGRHEIVLKNISLTFPDDEIEMNIVRSKSYANNNYYQDYMKVNDKIDPKRKKIMFLDHFLPYPQPNYIQDFEYHRYIRSFIMNFIKELKSVEFIGQFRVPPIRSYMFSGESPDSVGVHGERAIDIMVMDHLKQKGKGKREIVNRISDWLKSCQISERMSIKTLSEKHFEVVLSHLSSNSEENLADVGYGCSQVLPILVAGYKLKANSIIMVQEPEIHLHPKAQAELGTFFYELAKKGIQTIIETHSEHLMLRLQAHIADKKSELNPDDLRVYYIYIENGSRKIKKMNLKEDGFFEDSWPQGFFPERYLEAKKIAKGTLTP
jgi:predicted ATPase